MTNSIPLIDAHQRNCTLRWSVGENSLIFSVFRFDGDRFVTPPDSFSDALSTALEDKFIEIIDLFDGC